MKNEEQEKSPHPKSKGFMFLTGVLMRFNKKGTLVKKNTAQVIFLPEEYKGCSGHEHGAYVNTYRMGGHVVEETPTQVHQEYERTMFEGEE